MSDSDNTIVMQNKRTKSITVRVPLNIYKYLELMASIYTNSDISEYIRFLILKDFEKKSQYLEVEEQ
jgi:hypothetical protein